MQTGLKTFREGHCRIILVKTYESFLLFTQMDIPMEAEYMGHIQLNVKAGKAFLA